MILTIDLNPTIDRKFIVDEIAKNKETEAKLSASNPGGSGVTIARLLGIFNEETVITGFLAGLNGEFYHNRLMENHIIHRVVTVKDETRIRVEIIEEEGDKVIIYDKGPRILRDDIVAFYELYRELLERTNIIIGSSSLPEGVDSDVYYNLINLCNREEKIFILDAVGEELSKGIDASPHVVIISKRELEALVNLNLTCENDIIRAAKYILDKGVKILVINLQEKGIIVLEESRGYRLELLDQDINMKRCDNGGIVAGLALGISREYDLEMTLKLSQAFSICYTREEDISLLDMSSIKKLMGEIDIYPIKH